jgi:hypothetical protein
MVYPMKPRASFLMVTLILVVCLVCPLTELFDQWDHTLQTGNDSEYTLVILALCVGAAFLLKLLTPLDVLPDAPVETVRALRSCAHILCLTHSFSVVPIQESPPTASLRI